MAKKCAPSGIEGKKPKDVTKEQPSGTRKKRAEPTVAPIKKPKK